MSKLKIGLMLIIFITVGTVIYFFVSKDDSNSSIISKMNVERSNSSSKEVKKEDSAKSKLNSITDNNSQEFLDNNILTEIVKFFDEEDYSVSNNGSVVTVKYDNDGYISYVEFDITNGINSNLIATLIQLNKGSGDVIYKREFVYNDTSISDSNEFTMHNYLQAISDVLKDSYSGFNHNGD